MYLYLKFIVYLVLILNYKCTYNQSDQLDKLIIALYWELVLILR